MTCKISMLISKVLIESDWNLKKNILIIQRFYPSINRIRLEFKGLCLILGHGIKRVLIESDWNLKVAILVYIKKNNLY